MSLLNTLVNSVVATATIKTDKDAIQALLKIIDENNIELDEYDKTVVTHIRYR